MDSERAGGRRMIRVLFVTTGLDTGGAELMLYRLIAGLDRATFACSVVSLTDCGPTAAKLRALGVPVQALGMRRGVPDPRAVPRLARWMRRLAPDVVQTWMYHADLIGGLAARLAGRRALAWSLRQSTLDARTSKRSTVWTVRACAPLSRFVPARIVCCSEASRRVHVAAGYTSRKMLVIPNGFDVGAFRPDPGVRVAVRRELSVPDDALLVGLVARWDPQKDHATFLRAAARVAARCPAQFVLCGEGVTSDNAVLAGWIEAAGLGGRCHLLGSRDDMPRLTAALDVACSASAYGEGFSNVLGEAMACEVVCVATDVGDAALIVGDTGRVVPPRDAAALAAALGEVLALDPGARAQLGRAARARVQQQFDLSTCVARYAALYSRLAAGAPRMPPAARRQSAPEPG
jgi:glycosyltransferase involved in cell wall biosynthesis